MLKYCKILLILLFSVCSMAGWSQTNRPYQMEIGLQGGGGYLVGEATPHIFMHPREAYGAQMRYKLGPRWAFALHAMQHTIFVPETQAYVEAGKYVTLPEDKRHMLNFDLTTEFHFLRYGDRHYDNSYRPLSPYMFLGVGCGLYRNAEGAIAPAAYIPFGIGLKWMFAHRWGLNLRWQHNFYFADDLEGQALLGNTYDLNKKNIFNNDLSSQFVLGIVFEFAQVRKICNTCDYR